MKIEIELKELVGLIRELQDRQTNDQGTELNKETVSKKTLTQISSGDYPKFNGITHC